MLSSLSTHRHNPDDDHSLALMAQKKRGSNRQNRFAPARGLGKLHNEISENRVPILSPCHTFLLLADFKRQSSRISAINLYPKRRPIEGVD